MVLDQAEKQWVRGEDKVCGRMVWERKEEGREGRREGELWGRFIKNRGSREASLAKMSVVSHRRYDCSTRTSEGTH